MKLKITGSLTLAAALLLSGCGAAAPAATAPADPAQSVLSQTAATAAPSAVTFTDALGRAVTVEQNPRRVAALIGSFADIWCLAGGQGSLVAAAADTWTYFDLGLGEEVVNLGAVKEPNTEALLAAAPDLVLASANTAADLEMQPLLEAAGLNVVYFEVDDFEDYLSMLALCTEMTGTPQNYEDYGLAVQAEVERVRAGQPGQGHRVLYLRAGGSSVKVKNSEGSVLGEMLADLGCENIADSETSLLEQLSLEAILAADPDEIFIVLQSSDPAVAEATLESELLSNPAWQQLTAVRQGRVYTMDQTLYNLKPNEKWGLAYENLAEILRQSKNGG